RVKDAGYAGIEWFPSGEQNEYQEVIRFLQEQQLQFCIVMTVVQHPSNFEDYLSALKKQLLELSAIRSGNYGPLFITAQTGREYFTVEQVEKCFACCKQISEQTGI